MKTTFLLAALTAAVSSYAQTDNTTKVDSAVSTSETVTTSVIEDSSSVRKDTLTSYPAYQKPADKTVYKLKPAVDIPLTAITAGWTIYGFSQVYSKDGSDVETIESLDKADINGFDRWAADVYNKNADKISDVPFYAAMPLPFLLLFDKKISKDAGKVGLLYLEAMSVTGLLYTGATYLVDRYRPYTYNSEAPMSDRTSGGAKNSFFAGHVALVGTSTFFMAKVYSDYHPDSKAKWAFYTGASLLTGATAYLRHAGGKHFPSDILLGTAVGTLSGILVPHFHKNKELKERRMSIYPFAGQSSGLAMVYRFK